MNFRTFVILCVLFAINITAISAQSLTQTIRGTLIDADNKQPIEGAQIIIIGTDPLKGTVSEIDGTFKIQDVPIGRVALDISYLGYQSVQLSDILLISGKETVINVSLQESIKKLDEVVVTAISNQGEARNEMAIASVRSISSEETNRYAGGFNDPARILSNFAGVNNSQDGSADIIVRGNSPKYLQWRLEGVQITSPNHFGDPSGLGSNGVSALNNNILATSDFYTGAFPSEYGDALSGVYDVKLRNGNNEKFEAILGAGIVGTDLTVEGPFKKGYGGSYLANYRFTTIGIVDKLGLFPDIGGIPSFQDGAFKIVLPTKKIGFFSLYGLAGNSAISFEDVSPKTWDLPGNSGQRDDINEDFAKKAHLINTGINHTIHFTKNTYLLTNLAYARNGIGDEVTENLIASDSTISSKKNFISKIVNNTYRFNLTVNTKLNAKANMQFGTKYAFRNQNFDISQLDDDGASRIPLTFFDEGISTINNFWNIKYRFNENLTMVAGVHNMNLLFNNKSTVEPRVAFNWVTNPQHSFNFGYGMHSTMEGVHNYFVKIKDVSGILSEPNGNLELLKAQHFVLGYQNSSIKNVRIKVDAYYQHLYDLPVENDIRSNYSTINETIDIRYVGLVSKGSGTNYGLELTIERFFANNYYFMINTTLFDSKYKALDGIARNTAFNSNYLVNALWGKEFVNLGKKKNKTFAINGKAFFGGGKRIIPLLRDASGNLAVDPANNRFYDQTKAYNHYLDDIYTLTLALSYKWSKTNRTHELFLNIDNLTNNRPRLGEYYDSEKPDKIGYQGPIGIFPNLLYRLYF
jgi:hypothetical protein